jgi:hypothetical protein
LSIVEQGTTALLQASSVVKRLTQQRDAAQVRISQLEKQLHDANERAKASAIIVRPTTSTSATTTTTTRDDELQTALNEARAMNERLVNDVERYREAAATARAHAALATRATMTSDVASSHNSDNDTQTFLVDEARAERDAALARAASLADLAADAGEL